MGQRERVSLRSIANFWQLLPVLPSTNPAIQQILESNPIATWEFPLRVIFLTDQELEMFSHQGQED